MSSKASPRVAGVESDEGPFTLRIRWIGGEESLVDLAAIVGAFGAYAPLRSAPGLFALAEVGEHGTDIVWPGGIDMSADTLWRIAQQGQ